MNHKPFCRRMGAAKTFSLYVAMVGSQICYSFATILLKISLEKGQNQLVFIVYRNLVATLVLAPFAYAFERKLYKTLTFSVFVKIFMLATLGSTIYQNLSYLGLDYSSATVASALNNVIPTFTFALAILFRMEKVTIKSVKGQAKIIGTVIGTGGALLFTFWKGEYLFPEFVKHPLIEIYGTSDSSSTSAAGVGHHHKHSWIKGSALVLISSVAYSAFLILQKEICKVYPAKVSLNTLICFFATLESSIIALVFDRNVELWKLGWNVKLLNIIYSGAFVSAVLYTIQTWCVSEKGPVFVAMFYPLILVFVAIFSAVLFAERLHLGSFIGAVLILVGLYCFLWGKTNKSNYEEGKSCDQETKSSSLDHKKLETSGVTDLSTISIASEITT